MAIVALVALVAIIAVIALVAIVALAAQVLPLLAYCHLLWMKHQAMVDEAVVLAPLTSHGDHFGVMERVQVGHPTAPITGTIIINIIVKYFELLCLSS